MLGWVGFWILTLIWGSLFLFSRVGVEQIHPTHITFIRLGIAAIGMNIIIILRRLPLPRDRNTLIQIILNGVGGLMLPIFMLNIGIQSVDSGLSSVLQATAAIFGAVVAHFVFVDERLSSLKIIGVIVSFVGVIILTQSSSPTGENTLMGQLVLIAGALFYAGFTIHSRVLMKRNIKPVVFSAIAMLSATGGIGVVMLIQILRGDLSYSLSPTLSSDALIIVLILAIVHSFLAYLLYYEVVERIGAANSTMVTYSIPPVALFLGVIFLDERLDIFLMLGACLIFCGIALTNSQSLRKFKTKKGMPKADHAL